MPAHAQSFTILMLLLDRVMRNFTTPTLRVMRKFTILILLLSGGEIIIDAARLVVGAMLVMLTRLVIVIQIDGKLGRGRKLGRFIVAIPEDSCGRLVIGRRALLVSVGVRNQSRKFCDGIPSRSGWVRLPIIEVARVQFSRPAPRRTRVR